jgi:hypothetical protein
MKEKIIDFIFFVAFVGDNIYGILFWWVMGTTVINYMGGHQPSNLKLLVILLLFLKSNLPPKT